MNTEAEKSTAYDLVRVHAMLARDAIKNKYGFISHQTEKHMDELLSKIDKDDEILKLYQKRWKSSFEDAHDKAMALSLYVDAVHGTYAVPNKYFQRAS